MRYIPTEILAIARTVDGTEHSVHDMDLVPEGERPRTNVFGDAFSSSGGSSGRGLVRRRKLRTDRRSSSGFGVLHRGGGGAVLLRTTMLVASSSRVDTGSWARSRISIWVASSAIWRSGWCTVVSAGLAQRAMDTSS